MKFIHQFDVLERLLNQEPEFKYSLNALAAFCGKEVEGTRVDFKAANTWFHLHQSLEDLIQRRVLSTVEERRAKQIVEDIDTEKYEKRRRKWLTAKRILKQQKQEQAMAHHARSNSGLSGGLVHNSGHVEQHYTVHYHSGGSGAEGSEPGVEVSKGAAKASQKSRPQDAHCGSANSTAATGFPVDDVIDTAAAPLKRPRSSAWADPGEQRYVEGQPPSVWGKKQGGAADAGTGFHAPELVLAAVPQNVPLPRVTDSAERFRMAMARLAAAQSRLLQEGEKALQAMAPELSAEEKNAAMERHERAIQDVKMAKEEATAAMKAKETEVLSEPLSGGPAVGPLWASTSHVPLDALPAPRSRTAASSPFWAATPSEDENGLVQHLQVRANRSPLNPNAAPFKPHAAKIPLRIESFADVSAVPEAQSADVGAAPKSRSGRSRDLPPRAPVASLSPNQLAYASPLSLLNPPAFASGKPNQLGLAAAGQLEMEEEVGGPGAGAAYCAKAILEDLQPEPPIQAPNQADVFQNGEYGWGDRKGSGGAGHKRWRSEARVPMTEEGGSGLSNMDLEANMETVPADVEESQCVFKAAQATGIELAGSGREAADGGQLSKETSEPPANSARDVFREDDAGTAVNHLPPQAASVLFRQPSSSDVNSLEEAAELANFTVNPTASNALESQLRHKSADAEALNRKLQARMAAMGGNLNVGSAGGSYSIPLTGSSIGVRSSAQLADRETADAAPVMKALGQAGGDIACRAPAAGETKALFSPGATKMGDSADVTVPLDAARHPVLSALDKRAAGNVRAPQDVDLQTAQGLRFQSAPLGVSEIGHRTDFQLAAQGGGKRELPRGFYSRAGKASSAPMDVGAAVPYPAADKSGGLGNEVVGDSEASFGSHFPILGLKKRDERFSTPVHKAAKMDVGTGAARDSVAAGTALGKISSGASKSALGVPGLKYQGLEAGAEPGGKSALGQAVFTQKKQGSCPEVSQDGREKMDACGVKDAKMPAAEQAPEANFAKSDIEQPPLPQVEITYEHRVQPNPVIEKAVHEVQNQQYSPAPSFADVPLGGVPATDLGKSKEELAHPINYGNANCHVAEGKETTERTVKPLEQPVTAQVQATQGIEANVTVADGASPPGSEHAFWKQSRIHAPSEPMPEAFPGPGLINIEKHSQEGAAQGAGHMAVRRNSDAGPSQLLKQPMGPLEVQITGEIVNRGPADSFMERTISAAQREKAGIVSGPLGLDNTAGLAVEGVERDKEAFAGNTSKGLKLEDRRAKNHAFTIDVFARSDAAGGARKSMSEGGSGCTGVPPRPAKKALTTPAKRRSSGGHTAKGSGPEGLQNANVRLTLKELRGHDSEVAVIGYEGKSRSGSHNDSANGSRSLKRRGSIDSDSEVPAASRQKTGNHDTGKAPDTEHAQASATAVSSRAALMSSTVYPGASQGGHAVQGDSSAMAREKYEPQTQGGPEPAPVPLSSEGTTGGMACLKAEERSNRTNWRNNEMYDMETESEDCP